MASKKIDIEVELKSQITQAKTDVGSLKKEGVFDSPNGIKNLTKLNGLIQKLETYDLEKLKGPALTKALNEFSKLRSLLDSAARSLTTYTEEFEQQQKVLNEATKELNKRKTTKSEKLQAKKDALQNVDLSGHTYFNSKTKKQVTKIETITDLLNNDQLEIRGEKGKNSVSKASYNKILESSGIKAYSEASKAYEDAKVEVDAQQVVVNTEQSNLDKLPKSGDVHPVTKTIQDNSGKASKLFSDIREQEDERQENDIKNAAEAINQQINATENQTSALGKAFKQFTLYNLAIRSMKTAVREAVQTVKELDKYLTEQAMVTGMSREQTYKLVGTYQQLALQCGATTKEIAQVSTEYMKQGKTIQESLILTEAAVSAAKVARVSVGDSVNYLTTALNGFRLSAEDAMKVSDKFAAVAASSATDYDELAIALSKVASQANLAGMSIDYTTALLTKGLETTREAPETMGTALKTIIARMRELGDYGETLEDGTDINNVESQLSYIGIALRDQQGELRSTEEVLDELGKKWDTLNKNQQAAVAKALAGTRQQSRLIAMMEDYERVTELQEISQRSAGATAAQAGTYLEGMEAAMNKIQVAWEKIIMTVTDSEVIINTFDFIGNFLDKVGDFLSTDFGIVATLTTVSLIGLNILSTKILENKIALKNKQIQQEIAKEDLKRKKNQSDLNLKKKEELLIETKKTLEDLKQAKAEKVAQGASAADIALLDAQITKQEQKVKNAQREYDLEKSVNESLTLQTTLQNQQLSNSLSLIGAFSGIVSILGIAFSIIQGIALASALIVKLKDAEYRKTIRNTIATKAQAAVEKIKAAFGMAGSVAANPF